MDISFLFKEKQAIIARLIVKPLAPLSMVNSIPGGHYKTLKEPTHMMICGLFENILNLHLSIKDRERIRKSLKKNIEKDKKKDFKYHFEGSNSSYLPIIGHLYEIDLVLCPIVTFHTDLWKRAYRRADATVHPKGTPNLDYQMLPLKNNLPLDDKGKIDNKAYEKLFKDNLGKFPLYYSTLSTREYITAHSDYILKLSIDIELFNLLSHAMLENDLGYLGTNDGWVSLKLEKL
jgi:CRISPR-associated protein Cas5